MIRISSWNRQGEIQTDLTLADCQQKLKARRSFLWMDIYDETSENSYSIMQDIFELHPLAIEDALEETHVPKIDDWGEYLSLVTIVIEPKEMLVDQTLTQELDIFIGKNYILTYHPQNSGTVNLI